LRPHQPSRRWQPPRAPTSRTLARRVTANAANRVILIVGMATCYVGHLTRGAPDLLKFVERQFVGLQHPDVVRFGGDPELREQVRQRVCEDLGRVNPHVVIAHSLGAVVAIEALAVCERSPQLLITAGAPLSWPRFAGTWSREAQRWLSSKSCAWLNLIDLSDEVTGFQIPPRIPYANAFNVVVSNDHYSDWFGPDGGISATHSLRHYLRHPAVKDAFLKVCK